MPTNSASVNLNGLNGSLVFITPCSKTFTYQCCNEAWTWHESQSKNKGYFAAAVSLCSLCKCNTKINICHRSIFMCKLRKGWKIVVVMFQYLHYTFWLLLFAYFCRIRLNRKNYADIKQKLSCDPRNCVHPEDNPLSQQDEVRIEKLDYSF